MCLDRNSGLQTFVYADLLLLFSKVTSLNCPSVFEASLNLRKYLVLMMNYIPSKTKPAEPV